MWLIYALLRKGDKAIVYLNDVTLCELKGAGSDVDAFSGLDLNAVHAFMAVVVVHWIVR